MSSDVLLKIDETSDINYVISLSLQAIDYQIGDDYEESIILGQTGEFYASFGIRFYA